MSIKSVLGAVFRGQEARSYHNYRGIGERKDFVWVGILGSILGITVASPQSTNDVFIKAACAVAPKTEDDSTVHITSDDSIDIYIKENKSAAAYLDLQQNTDRYFSQFPENLLEMFPKSPGALKLREEFLKASLKNEDNLRIARTKLESLNLTPDSIRYSIASLGSELQSQRKDAFLDYGIAVNKAEETCGEVAGHAYLPARLELANSLYEVLLYWEENFDALFKPISNTESDIKAFEEGKSTFLDGMEKAHGLHKTFAGYEITPESFLDGGYENSKRTITPEELQSLLAKMGVNVTAEEIKAKIEEQSNGEAMNMLLESDPRDFIYMQYTGTILNIYESIVYTTPAGLKRNEDIAEKNQELRESGARLYTSKEEDDEALKAYRHYLSIFAPFRQTFIQNPDTLKESRVKHRLYDQIVYSKFDGLMRRRTDDWYRFIASIDKNENLSVIDFDGRWWQNKDTPTKENEKRPLSGIYHLADNIRGHILH